MHLNLILAKVWCVLLELKREAVVNMHPLFLWADRIIHSKYDTLQFWAFM
jgi:hypothetical protein